MKHSNKEYNHNENFWAFTGLRMNWFNFANFKHDYVEEVYQSYMCFASRGPQTTEFRGDCK